MKITEYTLVEIKKLTYKQQPKAAFKRIRMGVAYYTFPLLVKGEENDGRLFFECEIPVTDMGEADFYSEMEAKYLLRWVKPEVVAYTIIK